MKLRCTQHTSGDCTHTLCHPGLVFELCSTCPVSKTLQFVKFHLLGAGTKDGDALSHPCIPTPLPFPCSSLISQGKQLKIMNNKKTSKRISQNIQLFDSKKSPGAASLTREACLPSRILHITLLQFFKEHTPRPHALLATLFSLGITLG